MLFTPASSEADTARSRATRNSNSNIGSANADDVETRIKAAMMQRITRAPLNACPGPPIPK
jgi:hypothetical protein